MPSKAQGLSLNTIIIAAIVLIVLLVLLGLLTGYFGKWTPQFTRLSDTKCSGEQVEQSQPCPAGTTENYAKEVQAGKKCCAKQTCEERGGSCCVSGSNIITRDDKGCIARNKDIPHCCS